ncbi:MAG: hypothetical protein JNL67_07220 [Planctomycetaceae bacterium]|nr:hypothetical protein [Planctomycetaceae bacterium]
MNDSDPGSIQNKPCYVDGPGVVILSLSLPDPWPVVAPSALQLRLEDGILAVGFLPERRILVEIARNAEGEVRLAGQAMSCEIAGLAGSGMIITIIWDSLDYIRIQINGKSTGQSDSEFPFDSTLTLANPTIPLPDKLIDPETSEKVRSARRKKLAKIQPELNRSLYGAETDWGCPINC